MSGGQKRFRAFISYSQKDKAHARRLHKALEAYRVPKGIDAPVIDSKTRKMGRFFRDDEEMGAASDLGEALRGAIADSENLIVICSPRAAQSRWVNKEVLHFKRTGRAENIFAVIVDGMPNTGDPKTECFPPALRFRVDATGQLTDAPAEPLGLDLRKEPRTRLKVRLAAGLLGLNFDDLWRRDKRRARGARIRTVALASATIGTIASVAFSIIAIGQRDREVSNAITLAQASMTALEANDEASALRLAILASRAGWASDTIDEGRFALSNAASVARIQVTIQNRRIEGAVFDAGGTRILSWGFDRTARIWDAETGEQIGPWLEHGGWVNGAVFSTDETRILTWSRDGTARLWDGASGAQIGSSLDHEGDVVGASFSADGTRALTWSTDDTARLWDAASGIQIGTSLLHESNVFGARFNSDNSTVLTWSGDDTARLWNAATGNQIGPALAHTKNVRGAIFSDDETEILTRSGNEARIWDSVSGEPIRPPIDHGDEIRGALFSPDGSTILTWGGTNIRFWDVTSGRQIWFFSHEGMIEGVSLSHDKSRLLSWGDDATARLWDLTTFEAIGPPLVHDDSVWGAAFSRNETRILTWSKDGTVRLWDTHTGGQIGPSIQHGDGVHSASFNREETQILTVDLDGALRVWAVEGGMGALPPKDMVGAICKLRLAGNTSIELVSDGATFWSESRNARLISSEDINRAAIISGREGEDVCAWEEPWWYPSARSVTGVFLD